MRRSIAIVGREQRSLDVASPADSMFSMAENNLAFAAKDPFVGRGIEGAKIMYAEGKKKLEG